MNRRRFINAIGAAIIGTAIALKLPETIAPLNHLFDRPRITFKAMMDAYQLAWNKSGEPHVMFLSPSTMADTRDMVSTHHSDPNYRFLAATVVDDPNVEDNIIQIHTLNGTVKEFYFV